jgi:hypothetical protein
LSPIKSRTSSNFSRRYSEDCRRFIDGVLLMTKHPPGPPMTLGNMRE